MKRLDVWLGKNLFQPPIIRWCQLTGMTQFAVYRYLWLAVAYYAIYRLDADDHWLLKTILLIGGVLWTFFAGLAPDAPCEPSNRLRKFFVAVTLLDCMLAAILVRMPSVSGFLILFAEYALTIKTIPPRETKKADVVGRKVEA